MEAIADTPSFVFLWCGSAEGLDAGRHILKKWGFRCAAGPRPTQSPTSNCRANPQVDPYLDGLSPPGLGAA